ncbi:MAG: NAD-dependent protein deacylase [Actinomycetota bacterium]
MDQIDRLAEWLASSTTGVVFTGAGISTESGIPDFRGPDGFWKRNDVQKFTFQNYVADEEHRKHRWRQAAEGRGFMRGTGQAAQPNAGHVAIARLEALGRIRGVVTQNVDRLHQDAGNKEVLELHGTTKRIGCLDCNEAWPSHVIIERVVAGEEDPRCSYCGGILKSKTISFGQSMPTDVVEEAQRWTLRCDVFIVVGSSLVVYPAAAMPGLAKQSGARLAIINREETEQDPLADVLIHGDAGPTLTALLARVEQLLV